MTSEQRTAGVTAQEAEVARSDEGWGHLSWMVGAKEMPGAEMTFGLVTILPGQRNPLHAHPNCEELLFVISGSCEHLLGDKTYRLEPGTVIRIPRGVKHWARCVSDEPLKAVIAFSSAHRVAENFEGEGAA